MREAGSLERAFRVLAENRIREAIEGGAFDHLEGSGRPLPDLDEPYDELWWLRRWLRREAAAADLRASLRGRRR